MHQHDKLINLAAKKILAPCGMFRRGALWVIWGRASENGGGKVIKAAPEELKEKYRLVFEPVKD